MVKDGCAYGSYALRNISIAYRVSLFALIFSIGAVGLLVKIDDIGLHLMAKESPAARATGPRKLRSSATAAS
jgi:predicted DNA repair protein MutK